MPQTSALHTGFARPAFCRTAVGARAAMMRMRGDGGPDQGRCPPSMTARALDARHT